MDQSDEDDVESERCKRRRLPKRIILVRHGESIGNVDGTAYTEIPDWKIPLTANGYEASIETGLKISSIIGDKSAPLFFYCSPYLRTKQTLHAILQNNNENPIAGVREEPQLTGHNLWIICKYAFKIYMVTEQQFGNFQCVEAVERAKKERDDYGRF